MDVFMATETSKACGQSKPCNNRLLRRRLTALSKDIREMKEMTGRGATLFFKTTDNKFLRVNGDRDNPICEVDASDPELLDWMNKQPREVKKLEKPVEDVGKEKLKQFEKLKTDLEKYFRDKVGTASDSATTSNNECARQSRDGSATASVSSSCCCSRLGRRRP
ncbi:hypothetical protein M0R45_036836 [Rubus argutus]|uniref:Uncharacterized protein n=1 Tax=Rubus argutus TaxID=59490 RepID=A0AAW1W1E1_RUBAR